MVKRHFDDWLRAYLQYTAHLEAPDKMHFWAGVAAVAGVLRRRCWIAMGEEFEWVPNFYIVFVAPPGVVAKSTTAGVAINLLKEVPGINFGPDAATWQALVETMQGAQEMVELEPGVMSPMACVTLNLSEFGTLLDTENKQLVDVMTSLWDGSKTVWRKVTKTQGTNEIVNPWINMIACTTPAWISSNFSHQAVSGGFVSRCVFVYAERKRHLRALPDEHIPPGHKEYRRKLVMDLQKIAELKGAFTLTPDARAWTNAWYARHHDVKRKRSAEELLSGYLERKQVQMMKLAMVLSAARRDDLKITQAEMEMSEAMVTALEADLPKVFRSMSARHGPMQAAMDVVRWLDTRREVPYAEAFKEFFTRFQPREFDQVLQACQRAGMLVVENRGGVVWLRGLSESPAQQDRAAVQAPVSSGPVAHRQLEEARQLVGKE